ncbi:MAG: SGNH/GDSL hydrolase family protein [Candidatus Omnitrophica bacterium]|nr:SGNH/GDSL hydrolase family protein [Candidatus Omnitrophota bacterium]
MKLKIGQKIVCIGDSITDCGRRGEFGPLGNGYVRYFHHLLHSAWPGNQVEIINKGIGGHTLMDLQLRWADDVLYYQPDWVTILIGINDVHRVIRKTEGWADHTPENFCRRYQEVLAVTKEKLPNCQLVCLEPFYITTDTTGQLKTQVLNQLESYQKAVEAMSRKFKAGLIKLQSVYRRQMKNFAPEQLAPDSVHPTLLGHMIIAWELFQFFTKPEKYGSH